MHGRADERCCCGRRSRVVLTPRRRRQVLRRRSRPDRKRISHIRKTTVTRKPITGEITKETVKTIARGMPGCSGEPVVTTSCAFYFLHARLRVHRAPGIPCALSLWANESCATRAFSRRENAIRCLKLESKLHCCRPGQAK